MEWARRLRASRCAPPYLSPEQLSGQAGDRASDVYALGVICYEMLTDRVPFDSIDLDHLKRRHKTRTPRPPQDFNHDLPPELSEAVMELLNRDPEARLRSFGTTQWDGGFKALLDNACASEPAKPSPTLPVTNPLPPGDVVAETIASAAAAAAGTVDESIRRQPVSAPVSLSPLQRSEQHYRSVLSLIALVMLSWLVIFAIQLRLGN